ncbi:hypothetical protein NY547_00480 [Cnuibacter physcomitrellae]|uniref:hypothetical protein n=1 Tax=Cnuibacter physcomitrellae TaxID=1619308 RepID=UPI002175D972|nr:hypothetical protein [Cnuibacter physcomitrellae]MCS5495712.1 hypothetical protein [Cnuibacter physcomitrellae]
MQKRGGRGPMNGEMMCLTCGDVYRGVDDLDWLTPSGEKGPPPPVVRRHSDRAVRRDWVAKGYLPHCGRGHLMPGADGLGNPLLVMSLFGEKGAGKGTLLRGMERRLSSGHLIPRGISGSVRKDQEGRFDREYPDAPLESTQRATEDKPRVPLYFDVTVADRLPTQGAQTNTRRIDLAVFDTGWEDQQTEAGVALAAPFIPYTDVIVFVVPPASLALLPPEIMQPPGTVELQSPTQTERGMNVVVSRLLDADHTPDERRRRATVIIALTKCDRYVGIDSFPSDLLRDRDYGPSAPPVGSQMAAEQAQLNAFVRDAGGLQLLNRAAQINGTVSIHAISGTGADDPRRAPAPVAAPNRSLDPLVLGLLRTGAWPSGAAVTA